MLLIRELRRRVRNTYLDHFWAVHEHGRSQRGYTRLWPSADEYRIAQARHALHDQRLAELTRGWQRADRVLKRLQLAALRRVFRKVRG